MIYRRLFALVAALVLTACAGRAASSSKPFTPAQRAQIVRIMRDAMKKDPSILRDAIVVLQADNDRLEAQARRDAVVKHQGALFDADDPSEGNPHGATTIVEFYDPRCPYCRKLEPLLSRFVSRDGNIRLVLKELPILGSASEMESKALLAAARQGRYRALRAALMRGTPDDPTVAWLRQVATKLGLDWLRLERDMNSPAVAKELRANQRLAADLGVQGTPTLIVGTRMIEGVDMAAIAAAVAAARHREATLTAAGLHLGRGSSHR